MNRGGSDSVAGIATHYGLGGPGIEARWEKDIHVHSLPEHFNWRSAAGCQRMRKQITHNTLKSETKIRNKPRIYQ
jgi:hypothetical protein